GNAGWAYYNLGDFEGALAQFQEAEQQAQQIGLPGHRLVWLQDAGLAEYKLRNLEGARKYDESALGIVLALPADSVVDELANINTNLALLLYEQGQYEAAKPYSDAAVIAARKSKDNTVITYAGLMQGLLAAHLSTDKEAQDILMSAWKLATD